MMTYTGDAYINNGCTYRLPCGICRLTSQQCPKQLNSYTYKVVDTETSQTANQSVNTKLKVMGDTE